ncbi:DUF4267 domain-containing protein [Puia sp.]|uniref:DUF4267 domain-containing protein n=1 Tax=Puia sp. TaxID=2045100 RepID=UPI002F41C8CA
MKTQNERLVWSVGSLSWWLVLLVALGIIFVGVRFILVPAAGAEGFGIGFSNVFDGDYGRIKGIRDIFSGLVLLPFLAMRMRRVAAWVFSSAIIIPLTDGMLVIGRNGWGDIAHWSIHWGTALYMIVVSVLLFRGAGDNRKS